MVERKNGTDYYHYTYTDHLGSIVATCSASGYKETEQNFDAWGRKRNPTTWSYSNVLNAPVWLYRGYTGHEGLKNFRLINMNGRMYDPVVGRMLSVDNYIQAGGYSQSYNRYSYAFNNPLKYDDPDGEWVHILAGAVIGGLVNGYIHRKDGGFWDGFWIGAASGAVIAATGGAAAVYATTGSFAGALTGSVVATASSTALGGVVAGGVGTLIGDPIRGLGNQARFGESYSAGQLLFNASLGAALGAATGAWMEARNAAKARDVARNSLREAAKTVDNQIGSVGIQSSRQGFGYGGRLMSPLGDGRTLVQLKNGKYVTAGFSNSTADLAIDAGVEVVNGYSITGTKELVGNTFYRNILDNDSGGQTQNILGLMRNFENEALKNGANSISISGASVINSKFMNPQLFSRFGYSFQNIGDGFFIFKILK